MQIAPQSELGSRTVDKLIEVKLLSGNTGWLLIHLEVQSQRDAEFASRMFTYFYRIKDKYNKTVVSLAVLGDGEMGWRPEVYREEFLGCELEFRFPIVKLLDHVSNVEQLEKSPNLFVLVILAHLMTMRTSHDLVDRCRWKLRLLRPLYQRGMSADEVRKMFRVLDWMMQLRKDLELEFLQSLAKYESERQMPYVTSVERIATEKGLEQGVLIGQIQLLQRMLGESVDSRESLVGLKLDELNQRLAELQQRFESINRHRS